MNHNFSVTIIMKKGKEITAVFKTLSHAKHYYDGLMTWIETFEKDILSIEIFDLVTNTRVPRD